MIALRARGAAFLAVYLALYHLYIGIYGSPTNRVFLPVHLCLALALCFIVQPLRRGGRAGALVDALGASGALAILAWCLAHIDDCHALTLEKVQHEIIRFSDSRAPRAFALTHW